jgi:hypothetical protein
MRFGLVLAMTVAIPALSLATTFRSIGPWFVSTEDGPVGPVQVVGQTGRGLGFNLRCEDGGHEIDVFGVVTRLDLHFGRPLSLNVVIDGGPGFELKGIAVQRNQAAFRVATDPVVAALRTGRAAVMRLTDVDGIAREQDFPLALADKAFRLYSQACP